MSKYKNKMLKIIEEMESTNVPLYFKMSSPSKISKKKGRAFSMPAGPDFGCPGATKACVNCYATKKRHMFSNVQKAFAHNWIVLKHFEKKKDLVGAAVLMSKEMPKDGIFRIHESSDFHSQFAVNLWTLVVQSNPNVDFYAYTRTFNLNYQPLLEQDNFLLWASTDEFNFNKAKLFVKTYKDYNVKHAYGPMDHKASIPDHSFICPVTNGKLKVEGACEKCKLCIIPERTKKNVVFLAH